MKVYQAEITKEALASLQPEKRQLVLLLGHAANEINVLSKFALMIPRKDTSHELVRQVETGQAVTLLLLHIGKLLEAWDLIKKRVNDCSQNARLLADMPSNGKVAYERLETVFGPNNVFRKIRSNLSFHYLDKGDLVERNFSALPSAEPWRMILHETRCNSFYWPSAMVMSHAMMQFSLRGAITSEMKDYLSQAKEALYDLVKLTVEVSGHVSTLFDELIVLILKPIVSTVTLSEADIGEVPRLSECIIPFFVNEKS
jgi:hypothetical protein